MTIRSGGPGRVAQTGDIPKDVEAISWEKISMQWFMCHMMMQLRIVNGLASDCLRKRNGSSLHVEEERDNPIAGGKNLPLVGNLWQIRFKAYSQGKIRVKMVLQVLHL